MAARAIHLHKNSLGNVFFHAIGDDVCFGLGIELVSKELNHFGLIAGLFWQIGGHSSRFVLFCSF